MKNKLLLSFIFSQSLVISGLFYLLWGRNNKDFLINGNLLFFLVIFSVISFLLGLALHSNDKNKYENGVRRDGIVKWYNSNKGFGFIEHDNGDDIFVHQTEIRQSGFRYLNLGDHVEFEIGKGKKGPVALKVIRTKIAESNEISNSSEETENYSINHVSENK